MSGMDVAVVRTSAANLAAVLAGLRRAGAEPRFVETGAEVEAARHLVLPGVGHFRAVRKALGHDGVDEAARRRIEAGRPTLAVCLGLQLLCEGSEESPGTAGLGCVPGQATRFPDSVRVPHMGWNRVEADEGARYLRSGYAYFANSYRLEAAPPGWTVARTDYAGSFVAAMERGGVLACQFHPELSGRWGGQLLERWLRTSAAAAADAGVEGATRGASSPRDGPGGSGAAVPAEVRRPAC